MLPAWSVALQFTAVEPTVNDVPEAGRQVTATAPSTRSLAVGSVYVTSTLELPVAFTRTSACAAMTGAVVSITLTVKLVGVDTLPAASCAVHDTLVLPTAKVLPEAGRHVALCAPSTASDVAGA